MVDFAFNRRKFLALTAAAASTTMLTGCGGLMGGRALENVGIQLYTLRSSMAESVGSTLQKVADIGYSFVEFAGYFDHSPQDIASMLQSTGLKAPSAHIPLTVLESDEQFNTMLELADIIGHDYIVLPWLDQNNRTLDRYKEIIDLMNRRGESIKAAGKQLAYHNHEFEFETVDGVVPFELMLTQTDENILQFELDLFWLKVADVDPISLIKRYPGRYPLMHIKDRASDGSMVNLGKGEIDFAKVFKSGDLAGVQYLFAEHDNPVDAFDFAKSGRAFLDQLRY